MYGNKYFNSKMTVYLYTHVSSWLVILGKKNSQFFGQFLCYCTCKGYIVFYRLHYSCTLYWYTLNIGHIFKTYQYMLNITPSYNMRQENKNAMCAWRKVVFFQGLFLWAFRKLLDLTLTFQLNQKWNYYLKNQVFNFLISFCFLVLLISLHEYCEFI